MCREQIYALSCDNICLAFATLKTLEDLREENKGKDFYNYLYIFFVLQDDVVCMMLGNSFFENLELHLSMNLSRRL